MQISLGRSKDDVVRFNTLSVPSIDKLAELIVAKHYSLSTFRDGYRKKANFLEAQAIGLDFDEGVTLAEAVDAFKDYAHIIAPTRSHGVEKNGKIQDRFRVILFLSSPITDCETFDATWFSLAERWPWLDQSCKDPSRFYYPSKSIESINAEGAPIDPVEPKPEEQRDAIDLAAIIPGTKGKLGQETVRFLEGGAVEGGRNRATFKAAKDFQQNLYDYEETLETILSALTSSGTISSDFSEEEVEATVRSAFSSEAKHDPRIQEKAFRLQQIGDFYASEDGEDIDWLADELLTAGGVSLISGDPKSGKSTIARQLVADVISGSSFWGRKVKPGTVHYYGIEEQAKVLKRSFKRLGIQDGAPLYIHVGDPLAESNVLADLREILVATKPALAVIDTAFDLLEVESENNYKEVKREFRKLRRIARESGTHIMCVHHNSKGQKDDKRRGNRAILGSTAISGGVDTIIVIEVEGETRLVTTSGREVNRWVRRELIFNNKDCTYSLGRAEEDDFL